MALYDNAVNLAKEYIGPAGQRFLDRQISSHLKLNPSELTRSNLPELSKWCFISGRLLIDEKQAVEFRDKISSLA